MNRTQAEHIARIACAYRTEWPTAALAHEITQAQGEDLDIITAVFLTARNPEHHTARRIHTVLAELTSPFTPTNDGRLQVTGPTPTDRTPCPAHPWDHATNCTACWSEIKTGQRTRDNYGKTQAA